MRPSWKHVSLALLAALALSPVRPTLHRAALAVSLSGCSASTADGTCERPADGELRVWFAAPAPTAVRVDGREISVTPVEVGGGTRIALDARVATVIEIETPGGTAHVHLSASSAPTWATEAARARARGDQETARALASPRLRDPDAAIRGRAAGIVARIELAAGHVAEAVRLFREASRDGRSAGRLSEAVDDALALSFALSQRAGDLTGAREALDQLEPWAEPYADGRARVPYYRALVASALGDVRTAGPLLREARERAERLGLSRLEWSVRNELALSLERAGRRAEALAELSALAATRDPAITACDRATALLNVGFATLARSQEPPGPCRQATADADAAVPWLRASLSLTEKECRDAHRAGLAHVLLGDAALTAGRPHEATRELAAVDLREASSGLRRDALDLEARIALARGDGARARAEYERLVALARATGRLDDERRALEGVGRALEVQRLPIQALETFAAAEALLEPASVLLPIGEATSFQGTRETASRARVELLLQRGRVAEALAAARSARAQVLAGLASIDGVATLSPADRGRWTIAIERYRSERRGIDAESSHDWELATSELRAVERARAEGLGRLRASLDAALAALPRASPSQAPFTGPGETALFAMTGRSELLLFVGEGDALRAHRLPLDAGASPLDVARAVVQAGAPELARARSVRIVTSADLSCVDVHAAPVGSGAPLGRAARVTYGMDLGEGPQGPRQPRALVVSDTRDDLPLARDEGRMVAAHLQSRMPVAHLAGRSATAAAVLDELGRASLLHYAGHARRADDELILPLAFGGRLTTSDVLALPMSPERVILSACEAGRGRPDGLAVGFGLVQAFLQKGAVEVLAPTRPVQDRLALTLAEALVAQAGAVDFGAALAQVDARPDTDWAAYRIWRR